MEHGTRFEKGVKACHPHLGLELPYPLATTMDILYTQGMAKIKGTLILSASLIISLVLPGQKALAETPGAAKGTATSLQVINEDVKPGQIVVNKNGEFTLAKEPFDTEIFGVVVESSSLSLVDNVDTKSRLIMQTGEAQILVSNSNGDIKKGDYITSSSVAGIGQKVDKVGYVIGKALEDYNPTDPNTPGLVWSTVEPKTAYVNNTVKTNLLTAIRSGALSPLLNPVESLRYMLAALIVAATFIIGFSTFGRSSGKSIEAMGRNPLAQGSIRAAMIFNMILSFGVMLIGLALAYLILVL